MLHTDDVLLPWRLKPLVNGLGLHAQVFQSINDDEQNLHLQIPIDYDIKE